MRRAYSRVTIEAFRPPSYSHARSDKRVSASLKVLAGAMFLSLALLHPKQALAGCTVTGTGIVSNLNSDDTVDCTGATSADVLTIGFHHNVTINVGDGVNPASLVNLTPSSATINLMTVVNGNINLFSGASVDGTSVMTIGLSGSVLNVANGASVTGQQGVVINGVGNLVGGTINNSGSISGSVFGVVVTQTKNAIINNSGTISGHIFGTSGVSLTINNTGTVNGGVSGLDPGDDTLINAGSISGNVLLNAGNDVLELQLGSAIAGLVRGGIGSDNLRFGGASDASFDLSTLGAGMKYDGFESLSKTGSSTWTLTGTTGFNGNFDIDGGGVLFTGTANNLVAINVAGGGQIHLSNATVTGSGALNNQGTVAIDGDAYLTMGTMAPGGAFVFGINAASQSPRITLTSGAVDLSSATVQIEVQPSDAMFTNGSNWLLAQGVGAAAGIANGQQLADNSALLNFYLYRGDTLFGAGFDNEVFAKALVALLADIASHGDDPNAVGLGGALDTIGLNGDPAIDALMLLFAQQQTDAQINEILDSLLPETEGVAADIATDAADQVLDVASRRLDGLRGTATVGLPYQVAALGAAGLRGGLDRKGVEVWGQAFGRIADQRRRSYNEGYDADGYGFAAGADTAFDGGRSLLGAAVAYTQTDADGDGVNRTASDVDSTQVMLYGDHLFENRVYAKGMLGYGWHANDIARHDVGGPGGPSALASYDAWSFAARAEAGRAYAHGAGLTLTPRAVASFVHYDADSYTESSPLGLSVAPEALESLRLGLGVVARWDVAIDADALLQPELRLDYRRGLIADRFETISEFAGAPGLAAFHTQGVEPGRDILNLGIGALLATAAGIDLRASYDLELKEDYTAHGGYIRASVAF